MDTALSPVSQAIVALHSRFIVERIWCQNPERRLRRFIEAVEAARAPLAAADRRWFDARVEAIRAELFCDCADAREAYSRTEAMVRRAA